MTPFQEFKTRLAETPDLHEGIGAATDDASFITAIGAAARELGFEFSAHEIKELVGQTAASDTELSDEELEMVAGGAGTRYSVARQFLGGLGTVNCSFGGGCTQTNGNAKLGGRTP